jgi:hypothetical protein
MINKDFYPTPRGVMKGMLGLLKRPLSNYVMVLDPSAGKGDLLENFLWARHQEKFAGRDRERWEWDDAYEIREHKDRAMEDVVAIEIEPDLRAILNDKNIRVVAEDFLKWNAHEQPDLILMNPPFSAGAEHLLHAWRMLREGEIVCLLNAETLRNPYTHARQQLLETIRANEATVKFIGKPFKDAERISHVEVALVHLEKKGSKSDFSFEYVNEQETPEFDPENLMNSLAPGGVIEALEASFAAAQRQFIEVINGTIKLAILVQPFSDGYSRAFEKLMPDAMKNPTPEGARSIYNAFSRTLNEFAWGSILDNPKFANLMTSRARADFDDFRKQQKKLEFSGHNVRQMINALMARSTQIMEQCVVDVFDELRKYDRDNTTHWEGWATNDAYRVNRKFIHPYAVNWDKGLGWRVSWGSESILADIDRAMCIVTNTPIEEIRSVNEVLRDMTRGTRIGTPSPLIGYSTFFNLKAFKKGTVHFEFRRDDVWEAFNRRAAQGKKWVRAAPKEARSKQEGFVFKEEMQL